MVEVVGRIAQRAQLSRWLTGALDGLPVVVIVHGPAGVGKSTLVEWAVGQAAQRGANTRTITVPERGDIVDDLRAAVADADQAMRRGVPQLLVVDDAQWLDDAGRHLVEHFAFRLGTAAATGQPARLCLVLVTRGDGLPHFVSQLVDEPIIRRLALAALDEREASELARRITPGITDRRTIGRLVQLSGGNPLTITALADSIALGQALPPPASTTGTIPVEVAWEARLATLSPAALRAAVVVALAEKVVQHRLGDILDVAGGDVALRELEAVGAVARRHAAGGSGPAAGGQGPAAGGQGVVFTHPLLRTTALHLATPDVVAEVAAELLDHFEANDGIVVEPGTLVRLSHAAGRSGARHRQLLHLAYVDAIAHRSWSAAGDLAEQILETASAAVERAEWMHRLGTARFNELDRDEATDRLIDAAELYGECARETSGESATTYRNGRAECLLLAMRTDFTRSGRRRHADFDGIIAEMISDESIDAHWRARAAAILAEAAYASPDHDRRAGLIDTALTLVEDVDEPLTEFLVQFAVGWHRLAMLDLEAAASSFTLADQASRSHADPWWIAGGLNRRGIVSFVAGDPMEAINDASAAAEVSALSSNWAEHGMALAVRSVAATRLGRFSEADNDTESMFLSTRRADASDPFLVSLSAAMWRRAVRGDEAGVAALVEVAHQHQLYIPFAEFVAAVMFGGIDKAVDELRPRWMMPRNGLSFRNVGFHLAQLEAAVLAGNLEVVDELSGLYAGAYEGGLRAGNDWPIGIALVMADAAIELGDSSAAAWLDRAQESAAVSGSVLEQAITDLLCARHAFAAGHGGQPELDLSHRALETLDALGAPLLARLQRERLTSVAGRIGTSTGRVRTVMYTDIVDSTRLLSSAGNAAWAMVLGEHHRIVRTVVSRHRGSIMTATGDGFSAWFSEPSDAVAAATSLHRAIEDAALVVPGGAIQLRIGLATGSVFDLGSDVSGLAVAEAARVMSTATPGRSHASQSVIDHGLDTAMTRSVGMYALKGLPQPLEIFELAYADAV